MSMVGYNIGKHHGTTEWGRNRDYFSRGPGGSGMVLLAEDGTFRVIRNHYWGADVWKFLLSWLQPPGSEMVDIK